jgi:hypothetical protein
MNEPKMIRQGDILLVPVPDQAMSLTPKPSKTRSNKRGHIVIAQGETSLHEHTVEETDAELVRQGERMLLWVHRQAIFATRSTETGMILPRHTPLELPGGLYEVRIQRRAQVTPAGMPQRWSRVSD